MTTPTIAADLKTIEAALKNAYSLFNSSDWSISAGKMTDAMVALQRVRMALQPSDAGVAVAGVDDDETEHGSGVATWPINDMERVTTP